MRLASILNFRALAALACFAAAAVMAQVPVPAGKALVTAIGGNVNYSRGGGALVPLPVGIFLEKGDRIQTGASSHADLEIGGGVGVIQVTPQSTLTLVNLQATEAGADRITDTQLDLSSGAIFAQVNKLSKGSHYEIRTLKGIAGVRGTALYLTANGDLTVADGTAGIAYPGNGVPPQAFVVRDGQTVSHGDSGPHDAPPQLLKEIMDSIWDAMHHGIGREITPFVPPGIETWVSPVLPHGRQLPPRGPQDNGNGGGGNDGGGDGGGGDGGGGEFLRR